MKFVIIACLFMMSCTHMSLNHSPKKSTVHSDSKIEIDETKEGPETGAYFDGEVEESENDISETYHLVLSAAGVRSLSYVGLLKELERKKQRVGVITGLGFASLVAALYGKYGTSNMVEWKLFQLRSLLTEQRLLTKKWKSSVSSFLEEEFKDDKIEKFKVATVFFRYNANIQRVESVTQGSALKIIEENIFLDSRDFSRSNPCFKKDYLDSTDKQLTNKRLVADALGEKVSFEKENSYLRGLFQKIIANKRDNVIHLKWKQVENYNIDKLVNINEVISIGENFSLDGVTN